MNKELFRNYFINKEEHYKISDEFMEWCSEDINRQQIKDGYIENAKNNNIEVDYKKHSPNQKWHLITSYCDILYKDKDKVYFSFKCPELIIWMCEACGITPTKDDIDIMKEYIIEKGRMGRNNAGKDLFKKYRKAILEEINKA